MCNTNSLFLPAPHHMPTTLQILARLTMQCVLYNKPVGSPPGDKGDLAAVLRPVKAGRYRPTCYHAQMVSLLGRGAILVPAGVTPAILKLGAFLALPTPKRVLSRVISSRALL